MKYCSQCGAQLSDDAKFCHQCGTAVPPPAPPSVPPPAPVPSPSVPSPAPPAPPSPPKKRKTRPRRSIDNETLMQGIQLCADGKYRWIYPFNMWTNPTILFLIYKIFFWIFVGIGLMILLLTWNTIEWGNTEKMWDDTWPFLAFFGFFCILILLAYALVAGMYGGKYTILFTMDERGINHEQIPEQAAKARMLGAITAAVGAAVGKPSMVGLGASSAARTSMYSDFANVRSVKRGRWGNVIKIREILSNNQVYVRNEDFDFVYNYIKEHCPRVK